MHQITLTLTSFFRSIYFFRMRARQNVKVLCVFVRFRSILSQNAKADARTKQQLSELRLLGPHLMISQEKKQLMENKKIFRKTTLDLQALDGSLRGLRSFRASP